jgi:hypothetical protein
VHSTVAYILQGDATTPTYAERVSPKHCPCSDAEQPDAAALPVNVALAENDVSTHTPATGISQGFTGQHPEYCTLSGHSTHAVPPTVLGHHFAVGIESVET